jgi:hypothetical protein
MTSDYVGSWTRRIIENAPKDETPDDVMRKMRSEPYLNRGRWAAYVVRLGEANRRADG